MRTLTTVEKHGCQIRHKKDGTEAQIVGTTFGGFIVHVPAEGRRLRLPFENVNDWETE